MPLYEYECTKCGNRFEKIHKYSDRSVKTCPKCKGKVVRLASAPAIQFKGSGWYITDYARKGAASGDDKSEKPAGDKSAGEKPASDKSAGEKAAGGKSAKEEKPSRSAKKGSRD